MGSYWTLSVNGYGLLEGKNSFDDRMLLLFRQEDAQIRTRKGHSKEEPNFAKYRYVCTVSEMRGRLDLMGFSVPRARADFERGRVDELNSQYEMTGTDPDDESDDDYVSFLKRYSFDKWARAFRKLIASGRDVYIESPYPHVRSTR